MATDINIVFLDKKYFALQFGITRHIVDIADKRFAWLVGRVRFTGKNNLHWAFGIIKQLFQTRQITENECCAFVGGKPTGKANEERIWINIAADRIIFVITKPSLARPGAFAHKTSQILL